MPQPIPTSKGPLTDPKTGWPLEVWFRYWAGGQNSRDVADAAEAAAETAADAAQAAAEATAAAALSAAYATQAEQETGSATDKIVSPGRQQFHLSACKGFTNFNGTGTLTARVAYNVSSIDDNGAGSYGVNWATDFSSVNNAPMASSTILTFIGTAATGNVPLLTQSAAFANTDSATVCCYGFGDQ